MSIEDEITRQYEQIAAVFDDLDDEQRGFVWQLAEQAVEMGAEVLAPVCPGCGQPPQLVISVRQAFCGNDDCAAFTWDMTRDPARFKAEAKIINLEREEQS